jgi:hypothetical protein
MTEYADVSGSNLDGAHDADADLTSEHDLTSEIDEREVGEREVDRALEEDVLLLEEVVDALVLPVWEPTGEPRVDEALDELTRLDPDVVHQHAGVFDGIHQRLRGTLSDLDTSA